MDARSVLPGSDASPRRPSDSIRRRYNYGSVGVPTDESSDDPCSVGVLADESTAS